MTTVNDRFRPFYVAGFTVALCFGSGVISAQTRYHQHCDKAIGAGESVRIIASACFGGKGVEQLVDVGFESTGIVVAVGNAWGPELPDIPGLVALGKDKAVSGTIYVDAEKKRLNEEYPGVAGFVVRYSADLKKILGGFRFGWGCATVTHSLIGDDGAVYLSGKCAPDFRNWLVDSVRSHQVISPVAGARTGGSDLYLARFNCETGHCEWVLVFEKAEVSSAAWEARVGRRPGVHAELRSPSELIFVAFDRLFVVGADGTKLRELAATGGGVLRGADPRDGSCYIAGDENTNTGREPWRRPFLRKFDRDGRLVWEIWRWDPKRVGDDKYRLVSDSSVRHVLPQPDGDLFVVGWSDGGNSVFNRQPTNLDQEASYQSGFIDSLWGAGAGTFHRILRIGGNPPTFRSGTIWCSFLTTKDKPNSLWIDDLAVLPDQRVAVVGRSAWALVESPDAWIRKYPDGSSGAYFALFSRDLDKLAFSSTLPALQGPLAMATHGSRTLIAATVRAANDSDQPLNAPGYQMQVSGPLDGYLLLIETAAAKP